MSTEESRRPVETLRYLAQSRSVESVPISERVACHVLPDRLVGRALQGHLTFVLYESNGVDPLRRVEGGLESPQQWWQRLRCRLRDPLPLVCRDPGSLDGTGPDVWFISPLVRLLRGCVQAGLTVLVDGRNPARPRLVASWAEADHVEWYLHDESRRSVRSVGLGDVDAIVPIAFSIVGDIVEGRQYPRVDSYEDQPVLVLKLPYYQLLQLLVTDYLRPGELVPLSLDQVAAQLSVVRGEPVTPLAVSYLLNYLANKSRREVLRRERDPVSNEWRYQCDHRYVQVGDARSRVAQSDVIDLFHP